jgi:hypothetical protein
MRAASGFAKHLILPFLPLEETMDLRTYLPIIPRAGGKFRGADRLIHRADRRVRLATSVR